MYSHRRTERDLGKLEMLNRSEHAAQVQRSSARASQLRRFGGLARLTAPAEATAVLGERQLT